MDKDWLPEQPTEQRSGPLAALDRGASSSQSVWCPAAVCPSKSARPGQYSPSAVQAASSSDLSPASSGASICYFSNWTSLGAHPFISVMSLRVLSWPVPSLTAPEISEMAKPSSTPLASLLEKSQHHNTKARSRAPDLATGGPGPTLAWPLTY